MEQGDQTLQLRLFRSTKRDITPACSSLQIKFFLKKEDHSKDILLWIQTQHDLFLCTLG